jgi:hypothetical protein
MALLLSVLMLIFLFVMLFPSIRQPTEPFQRFIDEIHPYSGLSPDHFYLFLNQMDALKANLRTNPEAAASALYQAVEHIRDMALYTQRADDDHADAMNHIATRLAAAGEDVIQSSARIIGVRFFPRYLNDIMADTSDDSDTFGPNHKKTATVCTRGACRG